MAVDWFQWFRYGVLALAGTAAVLGVAAMAVQRRTINPFSRTARFIRSTTDPVLKPLERRLLRMGGNPQSAPWLLIGGALVLGIVLVTLVGWIWNQVLDLRMASHFGQQTLMFTLVKWGFNLLQYALLIRVIASWLGFDRYSRWLKPVVWATDWLLAPLRRIVPPFGPFDVTPLIGWLLLALAKSLVLNLL